MTLGTVWLVAVALGTDAFSMAVGIGLVGIKWRRIIFISLLICAFHIFMPLIGLFLGSLLGKAIGRFASFIGAIVLLFIGIQMLREGLKSNKELTNVAEAIPKAYNSLWEVMILALSVSLDALTVGFGLGTIQVSLQLTVLIMGLVAGLMTATGFLLGKKLGHWLGEKAQIIGGLILVLIGVKMFS
ncbi:manganese efflux pump MntP family protein [Bacillota bacterium LX-D]|nr:manganese efflux pump MntP family protein [Bacillota bacterium LX-D]